VPVNTREKIKSWDELRPELERGSWLILTGEFDPLTPELAKAIEGCLTPAARTLVVIQRGWNPLLDVNARAVLLAALRSVDAVAIDSGQDLHELAVSNARVHVVNGCDCGNRESFERRVLSRQGQTDALEPVT
jgi:hypothetical protein